MIVKIEAGLVTDLRDAMKQQVERMEDHRFDDPDLADTGVGEMYSLGEAVLKTLEQMAEKIEETIPDYSQGNLNGDPG